MGELKCWGAGKCATAKIGVRPANNDDFIEVRIRDDHELNGHLQDGPSCMNGTLL
jgi:hypothetical protein